MRKISATYIFPGNKPPLKSGILICSDDGKILDLIDTDGQLEEEAGLEHYSGILVPGFVDVHCHLELSHLKGKMAPKTGLGEYTGNINKLRNQDEENQLLLVHNTFTNENDIKKLKSQRNTENTFLVLCSNSNLYIENRLPDVPLFRKHHLNICLGTDSLASNHKLSVLGEMITLQQHFPEISLEELIKWGTINGARALQTENQFGSFEPGKTPGVNLVTGADLKNLKLTPKSKVKKLV